MQFYSDPSKERDKWSLPDCEVFQLTAEETAVLDDDLVYSYLKEYPLATMNSRDRNKMLAAMIEENGITGGWFYWYCLPGCMPDSPPCGPFDSADAAIKAAREEANAYL